MYFFTRYDASRILIRKLTEVNDVITSSELNRAGFLDVILIVVPDKDSLKKILKRTFYGGGGGGNTRCSSENIGIVHQT